ncbi:hypothetical protein OG410_38815 [Streptomyces sp. NBC_00659]|nr:hypothetical protein [Streptomyces sp. NBC_00659]
MERAADRDTDRAGTVARGLVGQRRHRFDGAGDHDLFGAVDVGDPHLSPVRGTHPGGESPRSGHDVGAHEYRHGAGCEPVGFFHGGPALGDQSRGVLRVEHPGGGQGGVLAEAVSGTHRGPQVAHRRAQCVEHHHLQGEGGELGGVGARQLLGSGVEQQSAEIPSADLGETRDDLPVRGVAPGLTHAGALGSLTGEEQADTERHGLRTLSRSQG